MSQHATPSPKRSKENTPAASPILGIHMSIAGGVSRAVERACEVGADALQLFLKSSNQWIGKPIDPAEAERFRQLVAESGLATPVAHSCYLINLASPDPRLAGLSAKALADELERAERLGVDGVIIHPGAHMGAGESAGLQAVAEQINRIFAEQPNSQTAIYLETTAGQGTCLGWRFEHLAEIIAQVEDSHRIGVCLDTCHVFAAGYDLRTPETVADLLRSFDTTIGLDRLRVIHINDSKKPFGSRLDRHEHIGQGEIGETGFAALLREARLRPLRFILETPKGDDLDEDRQNLATLRRLVSYK